MKILLVTEYFYPESSGGTELYVYNLAQALQTTQHKINVLSVLDGNLKQRLYKGLNVSYIPFNHNIETAVITGEKPADNLDNFNVTIQEINPDVIHFHTLTTSIGIHHIKAAKQLGFKVVLTSHIAAHTCLRGTLMQMGKTVCDGKVEEKKCLNCYLQFRGIPEPFNYLFSLGIQFTSFPQNLAKVVEHKKKELQQLKESLDYLIVGSNWQRDVFAKNGFDPQKINLCRQAVAINPISVNVIKDSKKLVIGIIGRISSIKGLHILLKSLQHVAVENIELRIAAILVEDEIDYYRQQKKQVESLPHSVWIENLSNEKVGEFLQQLDVLCVPSQVLETGPFVVYEALAQGIPVLGSNLGGIAELISEGKNGWLFPYQDEKKLGLLIASFIDQKIEGRLLKNVAPINRPIEKLAEEMLELYQRL